MKAILKKTFIGGIALGAAAAFAFLVGNGCSGSQSVEMGPAEVVEAFNRAVTAGDFTKASELCDTVSMKDYLESYKEAWDVLCEEDSTILSIASSILEKAVIDTVESGVMTKDLASITTLPGARTLTSAEFIGEIRSRLEQALG